MVVDAAALWGSAVSTTALAAGVLYWFARGRQARIVPPAWPAVFAAFAAAFAIAGVGALLGAALGAAAGAVWLGASLLLFASGLRFLDESGRHAVVAAAAAAALIWLAAAWGLGLEPHRLATPLWLLAGAALGWLAFRFAAAAVAWRDTGTGLAAAGLALTALDGLARPWLLAAATEWAPLSAQGAALACALGLLAAAQRRSTRRLQRAERRLEYAIETLDEGFALYDRDDRLVMANSAYRSLFPGLADALSPGASYHELLEISAARGIYLEAAGREADWVRERLEHHREGGSPRVQQLADGRWVYLIERATPAGERVGLRLDITDLKAREQELVESERRYRDLIDGSIQGILIQNDWNLVFANRAMAEMLGYDSVAELLAVGRLDRLLAGHEIDRLAAYREARKSARPAPMRYEVDMRRRDGRDITCDCVVRSIHWRGQMVIQATLIDITERKRAEGELRAHKDELEARVEARTQSLRAANEELEAFSYSVSHDLRAPLRHVRGFAEALAEDHAEQLDERGRDYLDRLQRAAGRMEGLIDDLLELSRLTRTTLQRERCDLSRLAREVADELIAEGDRGHGLQIDVEPGMEASADPALLRVVLQNLLENAVKYSAREARARIRVGTASASDMRYFFVQDNGVGFDMAYAERLFGPFQRLHGEEEFAGEGIGLASVARIIHRHDGRVWAHSEPGAGATFCFTLAAD